MWLPSFATRRNGFKDCFSDMPNEHSNKKRSYSAPNPTVETSARAIAWRPSWTRKWQALDPAAIAYRGEFILAQALRQRGNSIVTNQFVAVLRPLRLTHRWAFLQPTRATVERGRLNRGHHAD
jgi:hypothetical protein